MNCPFKCTFLSTYTAEEMEYLFHSQVFDVLDLFLLNTLYVILGTGALALLGFLNLCICRKQGQQTRDNIITINNRQLRPFYVHPQFKDTLCQLSKYHLSLKLVCTSVIRLYVCNSFVRLSVIKKNKCQVFIFSLFPPK